MLGRLLRSFFSLDGTVVIRYHHFIAPVELSAYARVFVVMTALPHSPGLTEQRRGYGLHNVLALLVLALAFLAASFPARNSDLWFHLATGRLLAQGRFSFGADPFAYTTPQAYWVCHSWLFDWALYSLFSLIGATGLVVLKALVITALTGLLLRIRRPEGPAWLPVVCTTLAVLAVSPRLLLQPTCLSYFFLGLTFWLLWQVQTQPAPRFWPLLLIFVLWVNVDEWFVLGPLLTALFWLGRRLHGQRQIPGWIIPAGLAGCLLNPYIYHAFTLPAELSIVPWTSGLRADVRFRALFASPWDAEHLRAALRLNVAVLAYYALTLLGLASFLLHRPALRDGRLLIWLPFALLAVWQARLIPFFAVVAAPLTALNCQDLINTRYAAPCTRNRSVLRALYLALALSLVSLMALTWLGWLAGYDREERRVAWGVQEDPSLRRVAETLAHWRRQGLLLADERTFALAPEVAHYGAWFCPGEKHFFDHRYPLFPQAARDYETVCRALLPSLSNSEQKREADWRRILRDYKVSIVIFYDHDLQRLLAALRHLSNDPEQWTLLYLAGQAWIAGWNEARLSLPLSPEEGRRQGGFLSLAFDAEQLAFSPPDAKGRREAPLAPEQGPEQLPPRRDFWARLTHPRAAPSWESAAATMYLHYFQDSAAAQRQETWQILWSAYAAGLAGLAAQPSAVTQAAFQLFSARELLFRSEGGPQFLVSEQLGPFFAPVLERSPALLLLAIRAARQAVAANPDDANAWLRLGQAYLLLRDFTCEHSVRPEQLPPLNQLRHVQMVTALEQAARLDPDLEAAHHELAFLYGAANALDQSLEHRQQEVRLSRQAGIRPGESADDFAYRIEFLDQDTAKLVNLVQKKREQYLAAFPSCQGDCLTQARLALGLGLARQAIEEVLLPAPADLLGATGMRLELELLLSLGRAQEVRNILNDPRVHASKHALGLSEYGWPAYEWLHVLETAAVGDYAQCRQDMRALRRQVRTEYDQLRLQVRAVERRLPVFLPSLLPAVPPFLPAFVAWDLGHTLEEGKGRERTLRAQQADLCVLEGLLALEQGDVSAARALFAEAQEWGATVPFASRPIAVGYLNKLQAYPPAKAEKE
jgi:hypothetical protein